MLYGSTISIKNLSHYFGSGQLRQKILTEINLEIKPGQIVILTGPSGSGKTTLLSLLGALRTVQEGSVKVLGEELFGASASTAVSLRRNIGYVFQHHNLLASLSARQNVQMTLELQDSTGAKDQKATAAAMLEKVGLAERQEYYPDQLSGGQKQRVAIARALVHNPKLVLADEPTASLDSKSGRAVAELLTGLAREHGSTILLVTHDPRIVDLADRIVYMEDGCLKNDESRTALKLAS
jgi:putative ABC transport system ATP-binding protein